MKTAAPPPNPAVLAAPAPRRGWWGWACVLAAGWGLYGVLGGALGEWAARSFPGALEAAGASKVPDAALFAARRLRDALWLVTLATGVWAGGALILRYGFGARKDATLPRLLGVVLALLLLANAGLWLAGRQALFWMGLQLFHRENQAAFRTKERLLAEVATPERLVAVGSSQTNTQFTEERFNTLAAGRAWMMELHFPGSTAADVYFATERFSAREVGTFVYYTSTRSFSDGSMSSTRDLLRLRDLPETLRIGMWPAAMRGTTGRYTALAMAAPLFQYRSPLINAVTRLNTLDLRPPGEGGGLAPGGPLSPFQQAAFRRMLERLAAKGQRLVVIIGQHRPDVEAADAPGLRPAYEAFLREACAAFPGVALVRQEALHPQTMADYLDGSHATPEAAERFTEAFARWYFRAFTSNPGQPALR